jgi:hypothetical protein
MELEINKEYGGNILKFNGIGNQKRILREY